MDARLSYREAAVRGASPLKLVVLLYEQALDDLRRALAAIEQGQIEERTNRINHAIKVIGHLHASLDLERGGTVARDLERFYGVVRKGLMEAQCRQSAEILEEQISCLLVVREAWHEIERASTPQDPLPGGRPIPAAASPVDNLTDWSA